MPFRRALIFPKLRHRVLRGAKADPRRLGGTPYGWRRYSAQVDAYGRQLRIEAAREQQAIKWICAMYDANVPMLEICARRQNLRAWPLAGTSALYRILQRAGEEGPERPKPAPRTRRQPVEIKRDKQAAAMHAAQLSLRDIGARLLGEYYFPPRAAQWYAAAIRELLARASVPRATA